MLPDILNPSQNHRQTHKVDSQVYGLRLLGLTKEEVLFDLIKDELPAEAEDFLEPEEERQIKFR